MSEPFIYSELIEILIYVGLGCFIAIGTKLALFGSMLSAVAITLLIIIGFG